jgi:1-acyl-sn-glycerol-3-phosphate acyltransferase
MELVDHLWEGLVTGPVDLVIEFHPPLTVDQVGGRKKLAALVEDTIRRGQARALAGLVGRPKAPSAHAPAAAEPAHAA